MVLYHGKTGLLREKKIPAKEELASRCLYTNFLGLQVSRVSMCRASGHVFPPCLQLGFVQPDTLSAEHSSKNQIPEMFKPPASFQAFTSTPRSLAVLSRCAGSNGASLVVIYGARNWFRIHEQTLETQGVRTRLHLPFRLSPPILTAVAQSTWDLAITRSRSTRSGIFSSGTMLKKVS